MFGITCHPHGADEQIISNLIWTRMHVLFSTASARWFALGPCPQLILLKFNKPNGMDLINYLVCTKLVDK